MTFNKHQLDRFHEAALSLKLFSRAELTDENNRSLIEKLYVDPLPNEQVFQKLMAPNTTVITGRKGTGKSTVFQRAQHEIRKNQSSAISAYMDIRNVYEECQVDTSSLEKVAALEESLPTTEIKRLLLNKNFLRRLLSDIRDELKNQTEKSFFDKVINKFTGGTTEVFSGLDAIISRIEHPNYTEVTQYLRSQKSKSDQLEKRLTINANVNASAAPNNVSVASSLGGEGSSISSTSRNEESLQILMRILSIGEIIEELKKILQSIGMKHLYVFLDDFSELPNEAMETVVDSLISPLSRWSEFIKFKIAAYPGRVYLGSLDKTKIEEINLDIFGLHGSSGVVQMEEKAIDFVQRLVMRRIEFYCNTKPETYFSGKLEDVWRVLFYASMANPRTLGHVLLYSHETNLIYGRQIGVRSIQESAEKFFDEKILPFFSTGKFRLALRERSSVFSLKELVEKLVNKARSIRQDSSRGAESGTLYTHSSHFYVSKQYDDLFQSLELAFFVTKYYEQSDREGHRVSVYALNYGLCIKYQISFGRPTEKRADRLYFVSRPFDYNSVVRSYIAENQEIRCANCGTIFEVDVLPALRITQMRCLSCRDGVCEVLNISKKYEALIKEVSPELLLPETELGILQALKVENRPMVASEIAGELDCSGQLVGRRGKNLAERKLVSRQSTGTVFSYSLTHEAEASYFSFGGEDALDVENESQA